MQPRKCANAQDHAEVLIGTGNWKCRSSPPISKAEECWRSKRGARWGGGGAVTAFKKLPDNSMVRTDPEINSWRPDPTKAQNGNPAKINSAA